MYCNKYGIDCDKANAFGNCQSTACTNWSTKIIISKSNIKPYKADNFSIIKWNTDFTYLPVERNLLVIVKDERGDHPNYYTMVAWVVNTEPGEPVIWISDNDQIFDEVIMWAYLPEYENIQNIK